MYEFLEMQTTTVSGARFNWNVLISTSVSSSSPILVITGRWENPLMRWTSSGDHYLSVGEAAVKFDSKETAVEFVEKYGWQYTVSDVHFALCYDQTPLPMIH